MQAQILIRILAFFAATGPFLVTGCSTIKSNLYETDETGERQSKKLHGMPITIDVPTHLQIEVNAHYYYTVDSNKCLVPAPVKPTLDLTYSTVVMKELYTTDFKRPLSGSIDLALEMTGQYFKTISDKTVDTSITDIAALVSSIISNSTSLVPKATAKADDKPKADESAGFQFVTVIIASDLFDLRQPDLEASSSVP